MRLRCIRFSTTLGTYVEFGPTQLPVGLGLGLRLGLGLGLGLRLGLGLGLGLRLELGLGPNLIDRKLGGLEPDTSAQLYLSVDVPSVEIDAINPV